MSTPSRSKDAPAPRPGAVLKAGETLASGSSLAAVHGPSRLTMGADGNLVLFYMPLERNDNGRARQRDTSTDCDTNACRRNRPREIWSTDTGGNPGARLVLTKEGDAQVLLGDRVLWTSDTSRPGGSELVLQDDGNLVINAPSDGAPPGPTVAPSSNPAPSAPEGTPTGANPGGAVPIGHAAALMVPAHLQNSPLPVWATGTATPVFLGETLASGQIMAPNQYLQSENGTYELDMAPNGLLTLFSMTGTPCPMWVQPYGSEWAPVGVYRNRDYTPVPPVSGSSLVMAANGVLSLTTPYGDVPFSAGSAAYPGSSVTLQEDGNLVIYAGDNGGAVWSTGTETNLGSALCAGETMVPGQFLRAFGQEHSDETYQLQFANDSGEGWELDIITQKNGSMEDVGVSHVWASKSAPTSVYLTMQADGNLVIYNGNGSLEALWASNTDGNPGAFAGLSEMGNLTVLTATPTGNGTADYSYLFSSPNSLGADMGEAAKVSDEPMS